MHLGAAPNVETAPRAAQRGLAVDATADDEHLDGAPASMHTHALPEFHKVSPDEYFSDLTAYMA